MNIKQEAEALDHEAETLARQDQSRFIAIGRVMARMCDRERWRCLDDPRTGRPFDSLERWVCFRFKEQRATAFAARKVYETLHPNVPDEVLETITRGVLTIMAKRLPASAAKKPDVLQKAMTCSPAEFRQEMKAAYPDHFTDDDVVWTLHPTESQAELYDRILLKVQSYYGEAGALISKECALEYLLKECEEQMDSANTVNDVIPAAQGRSEASHGR